MPALPARLRQLDDRLAALPPDANAMLLSELDGYLAGILVCPGLIMPGEWLPAIWGGSDAEGAAPAFESLDEVQELFGLIMEHYNALSREFHRGGGSYAPIYDVDPRSGEVVWTFWMGGFRQAMALRPESSGAILESDDEDGILALTGLVALIAVDDGNSDGELPEEKVEELSQDAPDLIPHLVLELNAWRLRHAAERPAAPDGAAHRKVGRNDPCPCGSGRKFKRCCGAH